MNSGESGSSSWAVVRAFDATLGMLQPLLPNETPRPLRDDALFIESSHGQPNALSA